MINQVSCGCVYKTPTPELPNEYGYCPTHDRTVKLTAVEAREWHRKCSSCRSGKWYGQDRTQAYTDAVKHAVSSGHQFSEPQYQLFQKTVDKMKIKYGRKRIKRWVMSDAKPKALDTRPAMPKEPPF